MQRVCWMRLIMFHVLNMFLISLFEAWNCLPDIWQFACVTFEFVNFTQIPYLHVINCFWFSQLLYGVGSLEGYFRVCVFEYIGDFPCYWNVAHLFFFLLFLFCSWLVCVRCTCEFIFCTCSRWKLLFWAICCINVHSFCFLSDASGSECILVM